MSVFTEIAAKVEAFADAAIAAGEKSLEQILDTVTEGAADVLENVEPVVERSLLALVEQFGGTASDIVLSLFGAAGASLGGSEKANLAATTLVEAAAKKGVTIVSADVSTLVKNAFTAVEERLRAVA